MTAESFDKHTLLAIVNEMEVTPRHVWSVYSYVVRSGN